MIHFTQQDMFVAGGYLLSSFAVGYCVGTILKFFKQLGEKLS